MRRVDGVFNTDVYEKFYRKLYVTGTGSQYDPVVVDTSDTTHGLGNSFKSWETTDPGGLVAGVADESWTAAGFIKVQVAGPNDNLKVDGDVVAGDLLVGSPDANAQLIDYTNSSVSDPEVYREVAVALEAAAANVASGILLDPLGLKQSP